MNNDQLFTLLMVCAAVSVLALLTLWGRYERDSIRASHEAAIGRELLAAAGDESHARCVIESANLERLLRKKYDAETDKAMRRGFRTLHKVPRNVLRFPAITSHGRPLNFDDKGAA